MFTPILATDIMQLVDKFGLHTEVFIAHTIAFTILAVVVVVFGVKPIMKQLEERRKRIEEGEAMHARSVRELEEVKAEGDKILEEARESGKQEVEHARRTATRIRQELSDKAASEAQELLENAKLQAEMDSRREKDALKGEFARLIALATEQVTGKVLSEADHRAINAEAINHL